MERTNEKKTQDIGKKGDKEKKRKMTKINWKDEKNGKRKEKQ